MVDPAHLPLHHLGAPAEDQSRLHLPRLHLGEMPRLHLGEMPRLQSQVPRPQVPRPLEQGVAQLPPSQRWVARQLVWGGRLTDIVVLCSK